MTYARAGVAYTIDVGDLRQTCVGHRLDQPRRGKSGGMDLRARSVRKAACDKARPLAFDCTPAMAKVKRTPFRSLLSPLSSSEGRSGSAAVLRVLAL